MYLFIYSFIIIIIIIIIAIIFFPDKKKKKKKDSASQISCRKCIRLFDDIIIL